MPPNSAVSNPTNCTRITQKSNTHRNQETLNRLIANLKELFDSFETAQRTTALNPSTTQIIEPIKGDHDV